MSTKYKATCKCGATVNVPYSDSENFYEWLKGHNECLKHPPKREWVGLTVEERKQLWDEWENGHVVEATEAKLKEKNT
jgi:hypothetical protein